MVHVTAIITIVTKLISVANASTQLVISLYDVEPPWDKKQAGSASMSQPTTGGSDPSDPYD